MAQLVMVAIAAFGVYSFARTARDGEMRRVCTPLCALAPNYADRNRSVPDFELESLDGGKVRFSSYRGKVVILNFWTKNCRPCLEEMPSLAELGKVLNERKDIALVTISTDESMDDVKGTLRSVLSTDKPPFTVLLDATGDVVTEKFGTRLYPETWFVDTQGIIRARIDGARNWDSAIALDFAKSLGDPLACDVTFHRGRSTGELAFLCQDVTPMQ